MSFQRLGCHAVTQYFLAQMDEDAGDLISNLKLQKLDYYARDLRLRSTSSMARWSPHLAQLVTANPLSV